MITVSIPDSFTPERKYILSVLLDDFLGLDYSISGKAANAWVLNLDNGKQLVIEDAFFSHIKGKTFLEKSKMPGKPKPAYHQFMPDNNLPVIFGSPELTVKDDEIRCELDIFAGAFFLLTRWEMLVNNEKDKYQRFPDDENYLKKHGLQDRPLVDEYTETLRSMLSHLAPELKWKQHTYKPVITHDVDFITRYAGLKQYIKGLGGDLINRKNPLLWAKTTGDFLGYKLGFKKDVYDSFDFLMDVSEQNGLKSHFYFIPGKPGEYDVRYDIESTKAEDVINNIISRNHIVGVHGSYDAYDDKQRYGQELNRLKQHVQVVREGRQHYLRFKNPDTWQIQDDYGLKLDSSMGYATDAGFICGTCRAYHPFNLITRKKLSLQELPITLMDTALLNKKCSDHDFLAKVKSLNRQVRKYKGNFTLLWHNNNLENGNFRTNKSLYLKTIDAISE